MTTRDLHPNQMQGDERVCDLALKVLHAEMPWQRRLIEEQAKALPRPALVVVQLGDQQMPIQCEDPTFRVTSEESLARRTRGFRLELARIDGGYVFEVTKERLNLEQPDGDVLVSLELIGFFFGTAVVNDGEWHLCMSCDAITGLPYQRPLVRQPE